MSETLNEEQKRKLEELAKTPIQLTVPAGVLNLLLQYLSFCAECNPSVIPRNDEKGQRDIHREPLLYGNLRELVHLIDAWYAEMQRQIADAGGNLDALKASSERIQ
ncbi:MAG: hypothetical protein HY644_08155 [Acidobacteria bacterium]|nr:hypothetical protein [Acidobacteriota bacterium]